MTDGAGARGATHRAVLPLRDAVGLAAALAVESADRVGARALLLKGEAAMVQGLRPVGQPSDVDLLIEPQELAALEGELRRLGWRRRPEDDQLKVFPHHSVTLLHDDWPCDLDVHTRYPGIDPAASADAFAHLWQSRETVEVAHWPVPVPRRPEHAVIIGLTALREPWDERCQRHRQHLVQVLVQDPELRSHLLEAAEALSATSALLPLLQELGLGPVEADVPPPDREWLLYTHARVPATLRLVRLVEASGRERLRMLADALAPSRTAMASQDLGLETAGRAQLWRARLSRLRRGLRTAPAMLRDFRAYRRARTTTSGGSDGRR
nr:nucleotidyltransferase family protein [Micrococcus lylae]